MIARLRAWWLAFVEKHVISEEPAELYVPSRLDVLGGVGVRRESV